MLRPIIYHVGHGSRLRGHLLLQIEDDGPAPPAQCPGPLRRGGCCPPPAPQAAPAETSTSAKQEVRGGATVRRGDEASAAAAGAGGEWGTKWGGTGAEVGQG